MKDAPKPELIVLARESRALTQAELADRAGISQGYLSKAENGLQEMASGKLESIAAVLEYSPDFFYGKIAVQGVDALFHRKLKTTPVTKLRTAQAEINIRRMQILRLLQGVTIKSEHTFPRIDAEEAGGAVEVARLVRRHWQIPHGPIQSMTKVLEAAGGVVVPMSFATPKVSAAVLWPDTDDRPLFFVNEEHNSERQRFSLAHELAHVVMHRTVDPEWEQEADSFAAEFLMPAREIKPQLEGAKLTLARLMDIKHYWKVAMSAVAKRAKDLGAITERQARSLFTLLNSRGYLKKEPFPLPAEQPKTLRNVLRVHLDRHGYSLQELGQLAFVSDSEFVRRFQFASTDPKRLRAV